MKKPKAGDVVKVVGRGFGPQQGCKLISLDEKHGRAVVKPFGHKRTEIVSIKSVSQWVSRCSIQTTKREK